MATSRPRSLPISARANCTADDAVGKCVYIHAEPVGDLLQVRTADPSDYGKMPAVGVISEKYSATDCRLQLIGQVEGIYSGLTPGHVTFVDDDGSVTEVPPVPPPGGSVFVQTMGVNFGSEILMLNPNFSMVKRIG